MVYLRAGHRYEKYKRGEEGRGGIKIRKKSSPTDFLRDFILYNASAKWKKK
jgi:hypothetical protein